VTVAPQKLGADRTDGAPPTASRHVLGMRVDATSYRSAARRIVELASARLPSYVCVANVHMVMEAHDDAAFRDAVNAAVLVVPDGMPLVWALRLLGIDRPSRVRGPDLTRVVARRAAAEGLPIGLYGGREEVARAFADTLRRMAPGIRIVAVVSPPFRPLEDAEQTELIDELRASGARIIFVGLGCPKQERWMAAQAHRLDAVLLGVGAAFDFFGGSVREAPRRIPRIGFEWLFRLSQEPRRLAARYAKHNPRFIGLFALQLVRRLGHARGK
jgi:N-acetylglucosaminyldiphosphoundecaprenol N-acetyl-beta-D-mannosaminyltransferase